MGSKSQAKKQERVARLAEGAREAKPSAQPLRCPSCGAPVPLPPAGDVATCVFCKASVPLPDDVRTLRDAEEQEQGDRAEAERLYRKLGKPPSTALRAWVGAAELFAGAMAGMIALLFWLSSAFIFLSGLLLELFMHAIAPLVRIDFIDRFGGGTAYVGFGVVVILFGLFPKWLVGYLDQSAKIRLSLQANLAARFPERVGFPSTCRECGAALAVPPGALGVRCDFCGADNLVALPREWVSSAGARQEHFHASIVDAVAQGRALRSEARKELLAWAQPLAIALAVMCFLGKCAVWIDEDDVKVSYAQSMGSPRTLIADWDATVAMPIDQLVEFRQFKNFSVALHHGEIFEISSPDGGSCTSITVHNTTSFPFITRDDDVEWSPRDDGSYGAQYRAPYTGLFRIEINGIWQPDLQTHARWRTSRSASSGPRALTSVRGVPATMPPPPALTDAARAAVDKLHAPLFAFAPARPDLLATSGSADGAETAAHVWPLSSDKPGADVTMKDPVTAIALSSDGRRLAVAAPPTLEFESIPDDPAKTEPSDYACNVDDVTALVFLGAHTVASGDRHGAIWFWDVDLAMARARLLGTLPGPITSLAASPDGTTLTAAFAGGARSFHVDRVEAWTQSRVR